ncbi:hypothetical protein POL67_32715 [Polyangium sp. rjm3]|uniref:Uncharacterized protein n=1 Tax=Polyangium mundeleinium TaxID=2995306 RepID=A0ABT5EWF4_9BACT|nr:hypothetical protein [Polyangium mundeleinium]MDC0746136.1 hypothetical protein [Polyangium mundeleinium]
MKPFFARVEESLAVGVLAELPAVLMRDADRVRSLLWNCGVVNDEVGVLAADERSSLLEEHALVPGRVPARGRDEVVKLLRLTWANSRGHRLDALAVAWPEQPT